MTDEIPSNRHYAGGQECPGCGRKHPVHYRYCWDCGNTLGEPAELYERALEHWGANAQLDKTIEECAELIQAISRLINGQAEEADVVEEIADVDNMLGQLPHVFGHERVAEARRQERDRLDDRLQEDSDD